MIRSICIAVATAALLSACGEGASEPASAPADASADAAPGPSAAPAAAQSVVLNGEGLTFGSRTAAFGAPAADVVQSVASALGGEPTQTANPDCPNGGTEDFAWGDRLTLVTRDGAFVGWHSSAAGPATTSGVRTGDPVAKARSGAGFETMESQFDQQLFTTDGVYGFLNADNQSVGVLYAGDTCIAG